MAYMISAASTAHNQTTAQMFILETIIILRYAEGMLYGCFPFNLRNIKRCALKGYSFKTIFIASARIFFNKNGFVVVVVVLLFCKNITVMNTMIFVQFDAAASFRHHRFHTIIAK